MTIWKKAISVATSAALLASLLATAVAPGAFAVTTYGTLVQYTASATSVPADGLSYIDLTFSAPTGDASTGTVGVMTTAGTFTTGTGLFAASATNVYPKTSVQALGSLGAGTLRLTSPTAAGTASVSVSYTKDGVAQADSVTTFTFTAATGVAVSSAWSKTTLTAPTATAGGGATGVYATTVVNDANNVAIAAGAAVTWTIAGPAYFAAPNNSYTETKNAVAGTITSSQIWSTGQAGVATISTKVVYLGVTTLLPDKTLTFVGKAAKIVLSNGWNSIDVSNPVDADDALVYGGALFAEVTDANGQNIAANVTFAVGAYTPANIFTVDLTSKAYSTVDKGWYLDVMCVTTGTATVTLKASTTDAAGTITTVTSEAVTLTCENAISSAHPGTLTLAAGATAVAANSSVPILVTIKGSNGLPAPDLTSVTAVTNGVGTVFSSKGLSTKGTIDGVAKFTYFAPANSGSGTVTVFATNTVPTTASVTILIGPTGAGVAVGQVESALGVTTTGPWSKSTKVAKVGEFITFKIAAGSANAGKTIGIFIQQKDANGVWSAPVRFSARVADSKGNAFFHWRGTKAMWVSLKGGLGSVGQTNPIQARWQ